jgi:hypothetical protein
VNADGPRLRLGEVWRGIGRLYRDQWRLLLSAGLLVFAPLGLVEALDAHFQELDIDQLDDLAAVGVIALALGHAVTSLLGEVFYSGVVAAGVFRSGDGQRPTIRGIAAAIPWWRLVAVDLLFALITTLGLLLLVVPGFVFLVWFALAGPIVEFERRRPVAALRRSRELVRGSFWRAFAVVVPVVLVTNAVVDAVGAAGRSVIGESLLGEWVGSSLGELLATPLYAAAVVVLTLELIELERVEPQNPGISPSSPCTRTRRPRLRYS